MAAQARGAFELAEGHAEPALRSLRAAFERWQKVDAPYPVRRVRLLDRPRASGARGRRGRPARARCGAPSFERLGALPDLRRVEACKGPAAAARSHGLTARELEVLRQVAAGMTNKAIATRLFVSERTVDRHVSNIFAKLGVSSRAAATARAYENRLI